LGDKKIFAVVKRPYLFTGQPDKQRDTPHFVASAVGGDVRREGITGSSRGKKANYYNPAPAFLNLLKKSLSFQKKPVDTRYIDTISGFHYFSFHKDYNLQYAPKDSGDNAVYLAL
jgi:hypothetical protein